MDRAQLRKMKSEQLLNDQNIKINKYLPLVEDESEVKIRPKKEVAYRAMCLIIVAAYSQGMPKEQALSIIDQYDLQSHLTFNEKEYVDMQEPTEHMKIQFVWRYEAAWVLLWALGYVKTLEQPNDICDVDKLIGYMHDRSAQEFNDDSVLRPVNLLLDALDITYRYHWAVVDARLQGTMVDGMDSGVVYERHYALNWLTYYGNQDWDDISTDT